MVMPYHLHMPSYFLETFTEYPYLTLLVIINSSTVSIRAIYSFFSVQFVSDISLLFGLNV